MPGEKEPIPQFAKRIKDKYPEYKDINDTLLVQKIVAKYPEYAEKVDMGEPEVKKKGTAYIAASNFLKGGGKAGTSEAQSVGLGKIGTAASKKINDLPPHPPEEESGLTPTGKTADGIPTVTIDAEQTGGLGKVGASATVKQKSDFEKWAETAPRITFESKDPIGDAVEKERREAAKYIYPDQTTGKPTGITLQQSFLANNKLKASEQELLNAFGDDVQLAEGYLQKTLGEKGVQLSPKSDKKVPGLSEYMASQQKLNVGITPIEKFDTEEIAKAIDPQNKTQVAAFKTMARMRSLNNALQTGSGIDDMAAKYQGENIQELPKSKAGQRVDEFLNIPQVKELAENDPEFGAMYRDKKANLYSEYPAYGQKKVAQEIAQTLENNKMTGWLYANPSVKKTDKAVSELVEKGIFGPREVEVYEKAIRPYAIVHAADKVLPLTDLVHNAGYGIYKAGSDVLSSTRDILNKTVGGGFLDPQGNSLFQNLGLMETNEDRAKRLENEEFSTPHVTGSTGFRRTVQQGAEFAGFTLPMMGMAALKVPQAITMGLMFEGQNADQARKLFPKNVRAQDAYTALGTGLDMWLGEFLPTKKGAEGIKKAFMNDAKGVIADLTNKKITQDAAETQLGEKMFHFISNVVKGNAETGLVLTAFDKGHKILNAAFGKGSFNIPDEVMSAIDDAKTNFLTPTGLSAMGAIGKMPNSEGIKEKIYLDAANNPERYETGIAAKEKTNPTLAKEMRDNLIFLVDVNGYLEKQNIPQESVGKYLSRAIREKALQDEIKQSPDKILMRNHEKELRQIQVEKEKILDPDMTNTDFIEELYNEEIIPKSDRIYLENNETGKFEPNKVGEYLKYIAQQANGLIEDWKIDESGVGKPNMEHYSPMLIEAANERWAEEIEAAQPKEQKTGAAVIMPGEKNNTFDVPLKKVEIDQNSELPNENTPDEVIDVTEKASSPLPVEAGTGFRIGKIDKPNVITTVEQYKNYLKTALLNKPTAEVDGIAKTLDKAEQDILNDTRASKESKDLGLEAIRQLREENSLPVEGKEDVPETDFNHPKWDGKELWQRPYMGNEGDSMVSNPAVSEKGEMVTSFNPASMQKKMIEDYAAKGEYEKAIEKGEMTASDAKIILESAGVEVPQDILIDAGVEQSKKQNATTQSSDTKGGETAETVTEKVVESDKPTENKTSGDTAGVSDKGGSGTEPPKDAPGETKATPEENSNLIGITHAEMNKTAKELGMEEYEKDPETVKEWDEQVEERLQKDPNAVQKMLKRMKDGKIDDPIDQRMMLRYVASLKARIDANPTRELLAEFKEARRTSDISGRFLGKGLVARKGLMSAEDTLADFLATKEESQGSPLRDGQIVEETKKYKDLKKAKEDLENQLETEREQHARMVAEYGYNKAKAMAKKAAKKSSEDYKKERSDIKKSATEALKKIREGSLKSAVPGLAELKAIAPHVKKYLSSLAEQGVDKLDNAINQIHAEFKDLVEGITQKDILDIINNKYDETKKETRNEKAAKLRLLKREAQLIQELADVRKGLDKAKTKDDVNKKNSRITELEEKIKQVRESNKETKEPVSDESPFEFSEEEIATQKEEARLENRIKKLEDDIKTKNYLEEKDVPPPLKSSRKTILLKDKVIELEDKIRNERQRDEYAKKNVWLRRWDRLMQVLGIRRIVQTALDLSIPFRQGATLLGPRRIGTWGKSFGVMLKSVFNQKKYDRLMYDIRHSKEYHDMTKDGIVFNELNAADPTKRNEDFQKSFVYKIPYVSEPLKASNRAADAFLNTARYELYTKLTNNLERQGITRQSDPKAYQFAANWAMNMTGRGRMIDALENPLARTILGNTFYGARLMASRFNLLNPVTYFDPRTPKQVRYEAMKDMLSFTGTMMAVGGALAAQGAKISLNPWDSDFLQVRYGDKVYDISGGLANYVRTGLRLANAAYTRVSGNKYDANKTTGKAGQSVVKFFRNKLSPNTSYAADWFFGKASGEDFNASEAIQIYPMYADDVKKALKEDGAVSLLTVALPNILGIGYGNYAAKDEPSNSIEELLDRNANTEALDLSKIKNFNKGGAELTKQEKKEYIKERDAEITKSIHRLFEKGAVVIEDGQVKLKPYKELTKDQVIEETSMIKANATRKTKKKLFGEKEDDPDETQLEKERREEQKSRFPDEYEKDE